ncbi:hypothetical protein PSAB6_60077 [Paraburkholderia sabiae]|nr:hypothetical protein PSAB6_60077 [Paraburkholderia sabiae]
MLIQAGYARHLFMAVSCGAIVCEYIPDSCSSNISLHVLERFCQRSTILFCLADPLANRDTLG